MAIITKKTALIWVLIVGAVVAVWKFVAKSPEEGASVANRESASMTNGSATASTPTASAKRVSIETEYKTPAGSDKVGFSVVMDADGVITGAEATVLAENDISKKRQGAFSAEFPTSLVGKKLSELSGIDRVGGSSLTTASFNGSLDQLKSQL